MVKAIVFDVDGTLLDTEKLYIKAWRLAGEKYGYPIPDEALMQTRAVSRSVAEEIFKKYCGQDFPYETLRRARSELSEDLILNTPSQKLLMPHAKEILSFAKERGLWIAAATATNFEKTTAHLAAADLEGRFDVIVCGDMVENSKPAPDIFLEAARRLGVKSEECIVVGDTPADAMAGSAAGMRVVLIPDQVPANEKTRSLSWMILSGLKELKGVLEGESLR